MDIKERVLGIRYSMFEVLLVIVLYEALGFAWDLFKLMVGD